MELLLCQVENITSLVFQIHVCIQVVRHERLLIYLVDQSEQFSFYHSKELKLFLPKISSKR